MGDETRETLFSFTEELPQPSDRRSGQRYTTLLRVGVLETDDGKELCLIRNISAGGLKAHVYSDIPVGARAAVELKTGHVVSGRVLWARDANIGIGFDAPIDVGDVLASCAGVLGGQRPRMPRIEVDCFASLRAGSSIFRARTCDISQGGVKVKVETPLPQGDVVVSLTGFRPLHGVVRWSSDGQAGISFNEVVPLPELIQWLKERERVRRTSASSKGEDSGSAAA